MAKVSVTRGSQEISRKERRTRINELLYFIPSAVLKQLTPKQLENKLVAHLCAICEKVFRLQKGVKAHKEDAHEKKHDQEASPETTAIKTVTPTTPVTKRRPKHRLLREKPVFSYNDDFYCDYECGFSTKVLVSMSNHIKSHHSEMATTKIKHFKKYRDENGNIDLPRQQRSSDLDFTDETIPEPKLIKSMQVSCIQEADNKAEEIIVISDDEEEVDKIKVMSSHLVHSDGDPANQDDQLELKLQKNLREASSNVGGLADFEDELGAEESESEYSSDDEESDSAEDMSDEHAEECDFEYMSDKEEDEEFDTVCEISDTEENKDDWNDDSLVYMSDRGANQDDESEVLRKVKEMEKVNHKKDKWVDEEALETMESLTPIDELFSSSDEGTEFLDDQKNSLSTDKDEDNIDDVSKKNKRSMENVDNEDASKLAKFCIDATNAKSEDLDSDKDDIMECYMLVNGMLYAIADPD